jgi:hypothetical protein
MNLVRRRARHAERGSVTAETAVALPVIVVMLLMATWAIGLVVTHIRCLDAARDIARAVARGEPEDVARRVAPKGSTVQVSRNGDDVTAVVGVSRDWPLFGGAGTVRVEERATLQAEPDRTDGDAP